MNKQEKMEKFLKEFNKLLEKYNIGFELLLKFKHNGDNTAKPNKE